MNKVDALLKLCKKRFLKTLKALNALQSKHN